LYFVGKVTDSGKFTTALVKAEAVGILTVNPEGIGGFAGQFIAPEGVG
jgi:hypothetical protein